MDDETVTEVADTGGELLAPAEEASQIAENAEDILGTGPEDDGFITAIEEKLSELDLEDSPSTSDDVSDSETETSSEEADKPEDKDFPKAEDIPSLAEDEKAQAKWGELRSELDEARKELNELRDQSLVSELENQLNELKERNQEYEGEIAIARVEKSQEYMAAVTEPMQNIMNHAKAIADTYEGVTPETIYDTLSMDSRADQNEALSRITEDMSERDKMSLFRMVDDMEVLWERDEALKNNAAHALYELEQREQLASQEEAKREALTIRSAVSKVFDSLQDKTPDIGTELSNLKDGALKEDFSNLTPANKAFAIAAGSMLTPMIKALRERDSKISELNDDLKKFRASSPKIDPKETDVKPNVDSSDEDHGFLDGVVSGLHDLGVRID